MSDIGTVEGPPAAELKDCAFVLVGDPVQTHLDPDDQQTVIVPSREMLTGGNRAQVRRPARSSISRKASMLSFLSTSRRSKTRISPGFGSVGSPRAPAWLRRRDNGQSAASRRPAHCAAAASAIDRAPNRMKITPTTRVTATPWVRKNFLNRRQAGGEDQRRVGQQKAQEGGDEHLRRVRGATRRCTGSRSPKTSRAPPDRTSGW